MNEDLKLALLLTMWVFMLAIIGDGVGKWLS
jgi:hypothetical protein